jgi:hypothetical protein
MEGVIVTRVATGSASPTGWTPQPAPPSPAPPSSFGGRRRRAALVGAASTLLSLAGFAALTLFEQASGVITELRTDLKHFNETSADYVKREQIMRCWEQVRELSKEAAAANAARALQDQELKASERSREELTRDVQRLRVRLAYLEGRIGAKENGPPADGSE